MKASELIHILKEMLGEDTYRFIYDSKHEKLRLDHKILQRGMDLSLSEVLAKYETKQQAAIDEVVYTIDQTFKAMMQETADGFHEQVHIYPVIRSGSFPKTSKEGQPFITSPHTAETTIFYALDLGTTYRLIDEAILNKLQLSAEQVREMARFTVKKLPTTTKKDEVAGNIFYFVNANDGYDASRILNDTFLKKMAEDITGDMTVSVPHQDVLIIGDIRNEVGYDVLAQMTMHFFSIGAVPITSLSFIYEDGQLEPIFILAKNKGQKE